MITLKITIPAERIVVIIITWAENRVIFTNNLNELANLMFQLKKKLSHLELYIYFRNLKMKSNRYCDKAP